MGAGGSEAVRAIFLQFDQQAQRRRSILRLALVAVMALAVWSGTSRAEWPAQFTLVVVYGTASIVADPVFRRELSTAAMVTMLAMLALLCLCSYTVSRVQQRRLTSIAELTASRSLLLADVMTAVERERRTLAETLHDGALQTVLAAKQDLREAIRGTGDTSNVERASGLLGDVSHDLRQVTRELHPSVLDEAGLAAALQTLADSFSERTDVPVDCSINYPARHADDATLYGVARELLNNVARHANAHRVQLELSDGGDVVTLNVRDDGVGMLPGIVSRRLREGHIGLASHRARIETLGGTVDFLPVEAGTCVAVRLPLRIGQEAL
jgi:two-component system, NarL family, sensor kinase